MVQADMYRKLADSREDEIMHLQSKFENKKMSHIFTSQGWFEFKNRAYFFKFYSKQLLEDQKNSESRLRQEFSLIKSYVAKQDVVIQQHQENINKLSGKILNF